MIKVQTEISNSAIRIPNSELPAGWRWVKLEEVCEIDSSQVSPNTDLAKQLPYIGLEQIESGTGRFIEKINDSQGKLIQSTTFRFDSRHVLYGKLRPYLNKVATPHFEGRSTTELLPLLPNDGCDRYYLAWLLRREETVEEAMRHKTGTRMPRADMDELFKILVPVPCIEEQKRVATKIHELMQEVERARTACEKELEAANTLPAAYLREVFESEEAMRWERKRLEEVLKEPLKNGLNYRKEDFGSGIKFVNVSDVFCSASINNEKLDRINVSPTDVKKYQLQTGDILIVRSSLKREGVAFPALFIEDDEATVFCGFLIRIRPDKEKVEPFYMLNYLRSSIAREKLVGGSDTVTITNVDQGTLLSLYIALPSLDKQQSITSELKERMLQVEKLQSTIQNQQSALNALPQAILRKAFRGEL